MGKKMNMFFVLQSDNVSRKEKMAVSQAAMICDHISVCRTSLNSVKNKRININDFPLKETAPVGSVEFCREWMAFVGVKEPAPIDYPDQLKGFLGRKIESCYYWQAIEDAKKFENWTKWVKPAETKKWDAHVISIKNEEKLKINRNDVVWYSDAVQFGAEWRCYLNKHKLLGIGRYDDFDSVIDEQPVIKFAEEIANVIAGSGGAPIAYAVDVGYLDDKLVVVEFTDAWAVGLYKGDSMPVLPTDYANMIYDRWREIYLF